LDSKKKVTGLTLIKFPIGSQATIWWLKAIFNFYWGKEDKAPVCKRTDTKNPTLWH
jgi:hypothetical protein